LNKIFSINSAAANVAVIEGDYLNIFSSLLHEENFFSSTFQSKTKKFLKKFFLKKLSSVIKINENLNSQNLFISFLFYFLIIFFFLKNFLIFNAEKLMLIYFLLISSLIFFFCRFLLQKMLDTDIWKVLTIISELEIEGEKVLLILKSSFLELKNFIVLNFTILILEKNIELRLLKK